MIFDFWNAITGYFKDKPYWAKIRPLFTLLSLYIIAEVLAYQFIEWQYHIAPALSLYLSSYIFKQITLVFVAIGISGFFFSRLGRQKEEAEEHKLGKFVRNSGRKLVQRAAIVGLVLVVAIPVFRYFSPNDVSHIRIKFLREPDFDKYAFVYLIYELNKLQKNWYFEVDFDTFDENILTSREREDCSGDNTSLCYAEMIANGQAFVGITTEQLGEDFFWQNHDRVSVISTYRWQQDYAPPSTYEFLAYSIIVQSMVIHLNANCRGLPKDAFKESRVAYGDLFQFSPRRKEMKSAIMAAHLSRKGEELLLNCFGVEYMSICSNLLTLEWLHSQRVVENLHRSFGVKP